jgi:hypothetical protein
MRFDNFFAETSHALDRTFGVLFASSRTSRTCDTRGITIRASVVRLGKIWKRNDFGMIAFWRDVNPLMGWTFVDFVFHGTKKARLLRRA